MTTYKHRSEIPEEEKWNLTDLYATEADWHSDLKKLKHSHRSLQALMETLQMDNPYMSS